MKKIVSLLFLSALLSIIIIGCAKSTGNEYIGKWANSQLASDNIEIKRNGDNFIVDQTQPSILDGKDHTVEFPAAWKDNMLSVNAGFGNITISYVKDDDTILFNGHKYIRKSK